MVCLRACCIPPDFGKDGVMGMFFGGLGSLLILFAAFGVILCFCREMKWIRKSTAETVWKISAFSVAVGLTYLAALAYIRTCLYDSVNWFDFSALFPEVSIREGWIGRLCFGEYAAVAEVTSLIGASVFFNFLYFMLQNICPRQRAWDILIFAAFFPGFFRLFAPTYFVWIFAAAAFLLWLFMHWRKRCVGLEKVLNGHVSPMVRITLYAAELILNGFLLYCSVLNG